MLGCGVVVVVVLGLDWWFLGGLENVWYCVCTCVSFKFEFFFFAKIEYGLYFLDRFDVLISKMIFKK